MDLSGLRDLRLVTQSMQSLPMRGFGRSFSAFSKDIKLAHSIFAMPFAMTAFIVAPMPPLSASHAILLLLCMVTARSFAMGMNRYLDRDIDIANPRTQLRMIPRGHLSPTQALSWSLIAAAVFVAAAFGLSPMAGYCALPMLVILMSYSLMKRWTWITHWYLGLCLGLAPVAVQIALMGTVTLPVVLLGLAVSLWTAGFDILYSLQDIAFDRTYGLHSVPCRFGPAASLWISRACFIAMIGMLGTVGVLAERGVLYYFGVAVVAGILTYEHALVRDARHTGASKHIGVAFFNANAYVSVAFFFFAVADFFALDMGLWNTAF